MPTRLDVTIAKTEPLQVRPMIASFALAALACGFLSWRFIFPVPAIFSAVLAAVLCRPSWRPGRVAIGNAGDRAARDYAS